MNDNLSCALFSITEEEPGPLRGDFEGKSGTKMSRTFSYLKNKMYKKNRVSQYFLLDYLIAEKNSNV